MTSMPSIRFTRRTLALAAAALLGLSTAAMAQDIQERTIKFGHLNNPDHPTSLGVRKFAEIVAATVLCGEVSLGAAVVAGEWVTAHEQLGRNRP